MATKDFANRADDPGASSKRFITYKDTDPTPNHSQGVALTDAALAHSGIETNPAFFRIPKPTNKYDSSAVETNALAKTGSGVLREIIAILDPAETTAQYLHLFDSTAAPSGTPSRRILMPAAGIFIYQPWGGWAFTTGLRVAFSSTLATYTASSTGGVFHVDMD